MTIFAPHFSILPPAQQMIWPRLEPLSVTPWVLYGGTAIALRLGHRVSVDFDFFSHTPLDKKELYRILPWLETGDVLQEQGHTLTLSLPVGDDYVKLSFFGSIDFGRVGEPEQAGAKDAPAVASLDDLLALKLATISSRVEIKDYRDIAAMLMAGKDLATGLAGAGALYKQQFSPAVALRSLVWFEDIPDLEKEVRDILVEAARRCPLQLPPVNRISNRLTASPDAV
ncbi:hypothetical protein OPIT5_05095 [Opitutaceae bacterium TAV5]|nr:hypothetical protein OPIT5_05095 [Opitutaceae bacterium TAV5]